MMQQPADPSAPHQSAFQIWKAPALLAVVTGVGLVSALVGDGFYDVLSWLALGAPIAVAAWCVFLRS